MSILLYGEMMADAGVSVHWLKKEAKSPIEKDWSTATNKTGDQLNASYRKGFNVGVRPGEHTIIDGKYLAIIDLDIRNSEKEFEAMEALRTYLPELDKIPTVASGSGGLSRHYWLLTDEPLTGKRALARSQSMFICHQTGRKRREWEIDLLGNGSQVVAPPSIHPDTKQPYTWLSNEPDWDWGDFTAESHVSLSVFDIEIMGDDSDLMSIVNANKPKLDLSVDEITDYLGKVNNDDLDYDEWFRIGAALHHQTDGSDEGYSLWVDWSASSGKHDERQMRKKWDSIANRHGEPVTFASVIKMAGGTVAISDCIFDRLKLQIENACSKEDLNKTITDVADAKLDNLDLSFICQAIIKRFKIVLEETITEAKLMKIIKSKRPTDKNGNFIDDYVFLTSTAEYMDRETKAVMGPRAFDVKHSRETPPNADGEKQSATMFSNDSITCVENAMYVPKFADLFTYEGRDYINLYGKSRLKRTKQGVTDIVERIKGHIAHLLPDQVEQQLVINYLAHNTQYPGEKIQWAIVLQGVQGDGKSLLAEMMQHVLGFNNVRQMNVQTLESSFTGWATGQCMTFIEELKLDNFRKYEVLNNLKPYITNPSIEVVKKGKDPQVVINTTNYFALTNFKDAIPIDKTDRRYCILFSQWQDSDKLKAFMDKHPSYYPDLYEDMRENAGEILDWLMSHSIPNEFKAMKRAPDTAAKGAMQNLSKSENYLLVEDALSEFASAMVSDYAVNVTDLVKRVGECFAEGYNDFPKTRALKQVLTDMGYHNIGVVKNEDRKNQVIYCKDDTRKAIDVFNEMREKDDESF